MIGVWWSGAEEDTIPAGDAAKGYIAAGFNVAGANFPVVQEIKKYVYAKGKGEMEDQTRIGSIYYNRGVVHGIITVEAIRTAQEKFGKKPLTPEQIRWGIENLNITEARLKELGAAGFMQPLKVTLRRSRGWRRGQVPAMGRQQVERDHRLDPAGQAAGARDDRGVRGRLREGKEHHAARLQQGVMSGFPVTT